MFRGARSDGALLHAVAHPLDRVRVMRIYHRGVYSNSDLGVYSNSIRECICGVSCMWICFFYPGVHLILCTYVPRGQSVMGSEVDRDLAIIGSCIRRVRFDQGLRHRVFISARAGKCEKIYGANGMYGARHLSDHL